jgi:hypothetical protein
MRQVNNKEQFTPFGIWIREYLRDSRDGLSVTNLDYVIEDFRNKKVLLLEEKQSGGVLHKAQTLTFKIIDRCLQAYAPRMNYEYWGFYVLIFPSGASMPGPGMTLNGKKITAEELQNHLNFKIKFCEPVALNL